MTTEAEINRIDARMTRIEDDVFAKLDQLDKRITDLTVALAERPDCPAPGSCVHIGQKLNETRELVLNSANRIAKLERWQFGVMAIVSALSFIGPAIVFAAGIAIKIHFKL